MQAAIAGPITEPGYLLEILWSTPVRLCTRGTLAVMGSTWTGWGFVVSGIGVDATSAKQGGSLTLSNRGYDISTLIFEEGIADIPVRIWTFYTDEPADADPVMLFDGVGAQADIDSQNNSVKVTLRQARDAVEYCPAHYITVEQGFSMLPPAGTIINVGLTSFVLEPDSF